MVFPSLQLGHVTEGASAPEGPLIEDLATDLYGVSYDGGTYQQGNVYKMAYVHGNYVYTDLYDFTGGSDGAGPVGNLVMGTPAATFTE